MLYLELTNVMFVWQ